MTVYINAIVLWTSDELKAQVLYACIKAAHYILTTEPSNTPSHAKRVLWAQAVFADPHEMATQISAGIMVDPAILAGNPTDATVQAAVEALINTFANLL